MTRAMLAAAAATLLVSGAAMAQAGGQITLYSKGHFKGSKLTVDGPWEHISPAFTVRSVQITGDSGWELCSGNTFTGCREFRRSDPAMVVVVRSARPAAQIVTSTTTVVPGGGKSLRGFTSEFFTAPSQSGNRIAVSPGTGEAARAAADQFCRGKGWHQSAYSRLQKVGEGYYLVDVLCADSGG